MRVCSEHWVLEVGDTTLKEEGTASERRVSQDKFLLPRSGQGPPAQSFCPMERLTGEPHKRGLRKWDPAHPSDRRLDFSSEAAASMKRSLPQMGSHMWLGLLGNPNTQLEHLCGEGFVLEHVTAHASSKPFCF